MGSDPQTARVRRPSRHAERKTVRTGHAIALPNRRMSTVCNRARTRPVQRLPVLALLSWQLCCIFEMCAGDDIIGDSLQLQHMEGHPARQRRCHFVMPVRGPRPPRMNVCGSRATTQLWDYQYRLRSFDSCM